MSLPLSRKDARAHVFKLVTTRSPRVCQNLRGRALLGCSFGFVTRLERAPNSARTRRVAHAPCNEPRLRKEKKLRKEKRVGRVGSSSVHARARSSSFRIRHCELSSVTICTKYVYVDKLCGDARVAAFSLPIENLFTRFAP